MNASQDFYKFRPHPWHGLDVGPNPPSTVHAYIEVTPFDGVKYEVDKKSGYLRCDRPQFSSSLPPTLYGFIPRTYCGDQVAKLSHLEKLGDYDPLDICVFSERYIGKSEILLNVKVIGGILLLDDGSVDDKIIGVLEKDPLWGDLQDVSELPISLIERLKHYFAFYKQMPGSACEIKVKQLYNREHAFRVINAAIIDYLDYFG